LLRRRMERPFLELGNKTSVPTIPKQEPLIAVLNYNPFFAAPHTAHIGENFHAAMFCFGWVAFFAVIGVIAYIASAL
jgi:hypothetical protein